MSKMMTVSEYVIRHGVSATIDGKRHAVVDYDFASRIERQRNQARRELKKMREANNVSGTPVP